MDIRSILGLRKLDEIPPRDYRLVVLSLIGVIALMAAGAVVAFFLTLRGEEQTLVPDVTGVELAAALVTLQEKELYPRISLRFTEDPESRGRIIEQSPAAGVIVKAGRRISLVVSRGAAQDRIGDYAGQNIDELKIHLQTVFSASRQLITVQEPPVYVYDKSPSGTILQQSPPPDTPVSGPVQLALVVSRGPERPKAKVPELVGQALDQAAARIEKAGVGFSFGVRPAEGKEKPGTIVAQVPAAGTMVESGSPVAIVYAEPVRKDGMSVGLFTWELPEYPYPLKTVLYAELPSGERKPLITAAHAGKTFTMPYEVPDGTVLVLQVLNKVVAKVQAGR